MCMPQQGGTCTLNLGFSSKTFATHFDVENIRGLKMPWADYRSI